jgi:hypothetical protein
VRLFSREAPSTSGVQSSPVTDDDSGMDVDVEVES